MALRLTEEEYEALVKRQAEAQGINQHGVNWRVKGRRVKGQQAEAQEVNWRAEAQQGVNWQLEREKTNDALVKEVRGMRSDHKKMWFSAALVWFFSSPVLMVLLAGFLFMMGVFMINTILTILGIISIGLMKMWVMRWPVVLILCGGIAWLVWWLIENGSRVGSK